MEINSPVSLKLPEWDKLCAELLLQGLIQQKLIDPSHIVATRQGNFFNHIGKTYRLEEILNYLTSYTAIVMPLDAPHFYLHVMKRGKIGLCHVWLPVKRTELESRLEGPSETLETQFVGASKRVAGRGNALLQLLLVGDLKDHLYSHPSEGIIVRFKDGSLCQRLKVYVNFLIGRWYTQKPERMDEFFNDFVFGIRNCYHLIAARVLGQYVVENETPSRAMLINKYSFEDPRYEQLVNDEFKGAMTYVRGRKLLHFMLNSDQSQIKICLDSKRFVYIGSDIDISRCQGSHVGMFVRWLVNTFVCGANVPPDALIFYKKILKGRAAAKSLLGKGVLSFLEHLEATPSRKRTAPLMRDRGGGMVHCSKCNHVFAINGQEVGWVNDLLVERAASPARSTGFDVQDTVDVGPPNVTLEHNTLKFFRKADREVQNDDAPGPPVSAMNMAAVKTEPFDNI